MLNIMNAVSKILRTTGLKLHQNLCGTNHGVKLLMTLIRHLQNGTSFAVLLWLKNMKHIIMLPVKL